MTCMEGAARPDPAVRAHEQAVSEGEPRCDIWQPYGNETQ